jgi:hypothetical protein
MAGHQKKTRPAFRSCVGLGPEQGIGRVTAVFFRARFIASIKNFNEASGLLISFQLASRKPWSANGKSRADN